MSPLVSVDSLRGNFTKIYPVPSTEMWNRSDSSCPTTVYIPRQWRCIYIIVLLCVRSEQVITIEIHQSQILNS